MRMRSGAVLATSIKKNYFNRERTGNNMHQVTTLNPHRKLNNDL